MLDLRLLECLSATPCEIVADEHPKLVCCHLILGRTGHVKTFLRLRELSIVKKRPDELVLAHDARRDAVHHGDVASWFDPLGASHVPAYPMLF